MIVALPQVAKLINKMQRSIRNSGAAVALGIESRGAS